MRPSELFQLSAEEKKKTAVLFLFFFLVIAAFWIQKPLRTSGLLTSGGIVALPWAKLLVAAVVLPALVVYAALTRRLRDRPRDVLVRACAGAFMLGLALFAVLGRRTTAAAFAYYLFVDLYVTVMVALFWSLAHEATPPPQARRTYPIVGAGGIAGGIAGSALTGWLSPVASPEVLLWTAAALLAPLAPLARALGPPSRGAENGGPDIHAAWNGARLTWASPYLLAIAALVVFYEVSSNVVDYLFHAHALKAFSEESVLSSFLGRFNAGVIGASVVFQLFLTSYLLRRRGARPGLLVLPAAFAAGSLLFLAAPALPAAAFLFFSDGSLHYSVNQTSKEALYTPAARQVKYEAKAFIDMVLFRFAKAFSALLIAAFNVWLLPRGWPLRTLTTVILLCLLVWVPAAVSAGKSFDRLKEG